MSKSSGHSSVRSAPRSEGCNVYWRADNMDSRISRYAPVLVLRAGPLVLLPMLLEAALAAGVAALIRKWSAPGGSWSDLHILALAFGPMLVGMLWGFFFVTSGNRADQIGQGTASAVAVVLMALFARRLQQREHVAAKSGSLQPHERKTI